MSSFDFAIKRGDRKPDLIVTLKDASGNAVDLTGATALFNMRVISGAVLKVNASAVVDPDQVANKGKVSYAWLAADTDTAGVYEGEFEMTFAGGLAQTFPNPTHMTVHIEDDLN